MKVLIIGGTGYIGSRLYLDLSSRGYEVDTVDLEWYGNYVNSDNINLDFNNLTADFLKKYHVVILLAAHSSVQMCINNNVSTFNNNVRNFVNLLPKLDKEQIFIYASSSSVYGQATYADENWATFIPNNAYDLSKAEIDNHARLSDVNYFGLRFGTVSGASENLRPDIMINSMVVGAEKHGIVLTTQNVHRPVLATKDLSRAIQRIITGAHKELRGIYNLASFNSSLHDVGLKVGELLGVETTYKEGSSGYDFTIDCSKFCRNFEFQFRENIESIVEDLSKQWYDTRAVKRDKKIPYL